MRLERIGSMANKLKEAFSDQPSKFYQTISFNDTEACKKFIEAERIAYEEGRPVNVTGIASMKLCCEIGEDSYPVSNVENIKEATIETHKTDCLIDVDTPNFGEQKIFFKQYPTKEGMIWETKDDMAYYIKLIFEQNETITFTSHILPDKADSIEELVQQLSVATAFVHNFFKSDIKNEKTEEADKIRKLINCFDYAANIFTKLWEVQYVLGITFDPKAEKNWNEKNIDIEELYLLLVKKNIIRVNAKLTSTDSKEIKIKKSLDEPIIGKKIDITFTGQYEYELGGQKFSIHSASLFTNAIVTDMEEMEDGKTRIIYGNNDSDPMFIANSAFVTEEEALFEVKNIMNHVEDYKGAKTLDEYLDEFYGEEPVKAKA
jgi:hypothetical protein